MRGYPKGPLNRQDYINLLADESMREHVRADLQALADPQDNEIEIDEAAEGKELQLKAIPNPMPAWKRAGFESREEIRGLIAQHEA
jgi:hypothetical protein